LLLVRLLHLHLGLFNLVLVRELLLPRGVLSGNLLRALLGLHGELLSLLSQPCALHVVLQSNLGTTLRELTPTLCG
jgi:hypothetical protein